MKFKPENESLKTIAYQVEINFLLNKVFKGNFCLYSGL